MAALSDMPSTFGILFQHIGYLSCCDPFAIACEQIAFTISFFSDLIEKDYGLRNKVAQICLCFLWYALYYISQVVFLIPYLFTLYMKMLKIYPVLYS